MIAVQFLLTFFRSKAGRYVLTGIFGALVVFSVYFAFKKKISHDLQRDAVIEERRRVDEAVRRGDSVPDDIERMRKSSDGRWCRDC